MVTFTYFFLVTGTLINVTNFPRKYHLHFIPLPPIVRFGIALVAIPG